MALLGTTTPAVPPDPINAPVEDPPTGGGAPSPDATNVETLNTSPEHQPADSWEEAAIDGDPILTPENEEVPFIFYNKSFNFL